MLFWADFSPPLKKVTATPLPANYQYSDMNFQTTKSFFVRQSFPSIFFATSSLFVFPLTFTLHHEQLPLYRTIHER